MAQIVAAIIALLTFLFGSNIIGNNCSKTRTQNHLATNELEKGMEEKRAILRKNQDLDVSYDSSIGGTIRFYEYKSRSSEIENAFWDYLENLVSKKDFKRAINAIDSLIRIKKGNSEIRTVLIDCKNGILFMQEKKFDSANWDGTTKIIIVGLKGKFGVYDTDKIEIFSPQFDDILIANNNLFLVRIDEKWGFANRKKIVLIYPRYDDVFDVYLPFTVVGIGDKKGLVNYRGIEVCQPKYDNIEMAKNGIVVLESNGKYEIIDTTGHKILNGQFDFIEIDSTKDILQLYSGGNEYLFYTLNRRLEKRT